MTEVSGKVRKVFESFPVPQEYNFNTCCAKQQLSSLPTTMRLLSETSSEKKTSNSVGSGDGGRLTVFSFAGKEASW
jgi:hypothetical protein